MKLRLLTFALSLLVLTACSKNDEDIAQQVEATITWTGSTVEGCGYIISTGDQYPRLKPVNESFIPDSYKTGEPIAVVLTIIDYKRQAIGCVMGRQYNEVRLLSIQRK